MIKPCCHKKQRGRVGRGGWEGAWEDLLGGFGGNAEKSYRRKATVQMTTAHFQIMHISRHTTHNKSSLMPLRCAENMYQPSRQVIDSIGPSGLDELVATKLDFKVDACSGQHKLAIQRRWLVSSRALI